MAEPSTTPPAQVPPSTSDKARTTDPTEAKRGDTVITDVVVSTRSRHMTHAHDDDARNEFLDQFKGKRVDNVKLVSREHVVGDHIKYTFSADVK